MGKSMSQLNSPSCTLRSHISGMRNPQVMVSMNGGHRFTVSFSPTPTALGIACGKSHSQAGKLRAAGTGRGQQAIQRLRAAKVIVKAISLGRCRHFSGRVPHFGAWPWSLSSA